MREHAKHYNPTPCGPACAEPGARLPDTGQSAEMDDLYTAVLLDLAKVERSYSAGSALSRGPGVPLRLTDDTAVIWLMYGKLDQQRLRQHVIPKAITPKLSASSSINVQACLNCLRPELHLT
jgi:hypothetical protein